MRVATRALQRTATDAGYAPFCAPDGSQRATSDGPLPGNAMVVGPDGTAAVGLVAADALDLLGESIYRDVALEAAHALARTQRVTGGWPSVADGQGYTRVAYRDSRPQRGADPSSDLRGAVTVDALRLLLALAEQTDDEAVRDAAQYGLRAMLNAQLADGGWPRQLPLPDDDGRYSWLADGVTSGLLRLLLPRPEPGCEQAARRAGELLLQVAADDGGAARVRPGGGYAPGDIAAGLQALVVATGEVRWREALDRLAARPEFAGHLPAVPPAPGAVSSRAERARLTAARAPGVADWVGSLDGLGYWLVDGRVSVARYVTAMRELLAYLRDYEPLPDFPGSDGGRPPQHRR